MPVGATSRTVNCGEKLDFSSAMLAMSALGVCGCALHPTAQGPARAAAPHSANPAPLRIIIAVNVADPARADGEREVSG